MKRSWQGVLAAVALAATLAAPVLAEENAATRLTLASWNLNELGHDPDKHYNALGYVVAAAGLDFLAVQEVMNEEGAWFLRGAIERYTKTEWELMVSETIGRSSYRERYAFLWRADKVEYVSGEAVLPDQEDRFAREPYAARFRWLSTGQTFVAANIHVVYGQSESEREPEIAALAPYWEWLRDSFPAEADRTFLFGTFYLWAREPAWKALKAHADPLMPRIGTTIGQREGRYPSRYDNIWVAKGHPFGALEAHPYKFPQHFEWTHEKSRKFVSDHIPIYVTLEKP